MSNLRVAYVINDASFFLSHRLPLAIEVLKKGGKVCLITGTNINETIEKDAIKKIQLNNIQYYKCIFSQGIKNPISEILGLFQLIIHLKRFNPTTIHSATAKANLMTCIACNFVKKSKLILSVSGMGTMFTGEIGFKKKLLRFLFILIFKTSLRKLNYVIIFQNSDDLKTFHSLLRFDISKARLICGSGVDTRKLKPLKKLSKITKILLPARILYEKGVEEFVESSIIIQKKSIKCIFYLAGDFNSLNPSAIPKSIIEKWVAMGHIIYLGHQTNINHMYKDIDIVCLPSWREGFPKVLMEAASLGLPVVTTNVPGCKDAVINNITGFIVPVRNKNKLADSIMKLIQQPKLRKQMGIKNRILAKEKFDLKVIVPKIVNLYL